MQGGKVTFEEPLGQDVYISWITNEQISWREAIGKNSHLSNPSQLTSANKIHARSELWLWQDSVEDDFEGRDKDRLMEQPWKEVLIHRSDHVYMLVLNISCVKSYPQPYA